MRLILLAAGLACMACVAFSLTGCSSEPESGPPPAPEIRENSDLAWDLLAVAPLFADAPELRRVAFFRLAFDTFGPYLGADGSSYRSGFQIYQPEMTAAHLLRRDYVGVKENRWIETGPDEEVPIIPIVFHGSATAEPPRLDARLVTVNDLGGSAELRAKPRSVTWAAGRITPQKSIVLETPQLRPSAGAVVLELRGEDNQLIAANLLPIIIRSEPPPAPRFELQHATRAFVRTTATTNPGARFELRFEIPPSVFEAGVTKMEMLAEVAAIAPDGGLKPIVAGRELDSVELPEASTGAGAVLSRWSGEKPARHGVLLRLPIAVDEQSLAAFRTNPAVLLDAAGGPALRLFGETAGRYPLDPTLIIETRDPIETPDGP